MTKNEMNLYMSYLDDNSDVLLKNSEQLEPIYKALVNIVMEFKQDYGEVHTSMCNRYINELNKSAKNNISKLRSISGLTEGVVKKALNNNLVYCVAKQKDLLSAAFSEINTYSKKYGVSKMPITCFYRSMQTYSGDGHVSVKSRLKRLIEIGLILEDNEGVSIVFDTSLNKRSNEQSLKNLSEAINHLTSTIIYNKNKKDHMPSLFQRRLRSTQIHPSDSIELTNEVNKLAAMCVEQGNTLLTKFERDVPSGTYPEIVLHVFQYNKNLTENNS